MNRERDAVMATIGNFSTIQEAEIAAGMLRNAGIPCDVSNQTIASVLPMTDTWTPLQLMVPASMAAHARELLRSCGD